MKDIIEGPGPQSEANFDDLLAGPVGQNLDAPPQTLQRETSSYVSQDEKFILKKREYDRQFAQLYFYRLVQMRPFAEASAKALWSDAPIVRVLDVPEEGEVIIIGTLYKEMALKPSILDEYTKDRGIAAQLGRTKFAQPDDTLVLEDEGARIALTGDALPAGTCATGVIAAVRGSVLANGQFNVNAVTFAGIPPQKPLPQLDDDKYVALVSGLSLGESSTSPLHLQLLVDYCCGALGSSKEQSTAAKISRIIVAGGILKGVAELSLPTAYSTVRQQTLALEPIKEADVKLSELAGSIPIDIMPGAADPANYSLPQQPLHPCLFPGAAGFSSFTRCTNPHSCCIDGVNFLGTSGQNIDDIVRYSDLDESSIVLEKLLLWRHLIPTAPDTLAAYPYYDEDPFILDEAPHVLFAGCQPKFGTSLVEGKDGQIVRVVSVPEFALSGTMVLVNLKTLAVHPIQFEVPMDD